MGYDAKNMKDVQELIKNNNAYIASLRKYLKLPATEDPLAKCIEESMT